MLFTSVLVDFYLPHKVPAHNFPVTGVIKSLTDNAFYLAYIKINDCSICQGTDKIITVILFNLPGRDFPKTAILHIIYIYKSFKKAKKERCPLSGQRPYFGKAPKGNTQRFRNPDDRLHAEALLPALQLLYHLEG